MSAIVPIVIFAVFVFFAMTQLKKMKGAAGGSYAEARANLTQQFAALKQPGESEAPFVGMGTHQLAKNRQFYAALTNQRLFLSEIGGAMRTFPRNQIKIDVQRKKWSDHGNMQTTVTQGYEVSLSLPGGESHVLRLYIDNPYDSAHAPALSSFLGTLGVA